MDILKRSSVLTPARLKASWQATLSRQPRPGPDGLSVAQFAQNADARLNWLHGALQADDYRPGAAWRTWIAKPNGGERAVIALGLQDRIVEGALLSGIRGQPNSTRIRRLSPTGKGWGRSGLLPSCCGAGPRDWPGWSGAT